LVLVAFSSNDDLNFFRFRPCDHQRMCPAC